MPLLSRRNAIRALGLGAAAATFSVWPAAARPRRLPDNASWAVFYGAHAPTEAFTGFNVVVLDPGFTGPLTPIMENGATLLGYVSLGEITEANPRFAEMQRAGVVLRENANWSGAHAVDMRRSAWTRYILRDLLPNVLAKGFHGIFIDTLDTPAHLEETDPVAHQGMIQAAARLVRAIRREHPDIPIMLNRGYAVLPEVVQAIDAVLAESLITTYDFQSQTYKWVDAETVAQQMLLLEPARTAARPIPIFSLDYWHSTDPVTLAQIYEQERAMGHAPYVATILLDQLVPEPSAPA